MSSNPLNIKTELIWWSSFALLSTVLVALVTGFKFGTLDIQLHDTYYVVESADAIKLLTSIFGFGRYFYLLVDIIAERYLILALIICIINVLVALFVVIGAYLSIEAIGTSRRLYPDMDSSAHFLLPVIFMGLLAVQTLVEIRMIKKLRKLVVR